MTIYNQALTERMELALSGSKTSVLDWHFEGNTLYISPSWKEMLGYEDHELENSTESWRRRVHREDFRIVISLLREQQKSKSTYFVSTHRLKHKEGHWVWVLGRARIFFDENGKKIRMIGTHTDITEEKELQLKYFYQSQMIEQMNDSVTTTDLEGTIVSWNSGSVNTFGYSAEEAIGKNIAMLYQEKDRIFLPRHVETLIRTGKYNADFDLVTKSDQLVPISFSLSLLRDVHGDPIGVVGINKDNTRRKQAEDALLEQKEIFHYQAHHDNMTGLPNRILFTQRLDESILRTRRGDHGFALFFIDIDKFKDINDSLGHEIGDKVLKVIAKRLRNIIRKEDTLARLSGDEFTIIMDTLKERDDAAMLAGKILKMLEEPMSIDGHILYVTASIGISLYPEHASNAEYLLKYADTAMYNAKEEGRSTYRFYTSQMTESALEHLKMKTALRQGIDNEEFFIHYQPQIDVEQDKLIGIEALLRWNHPSKGLLSPDAFILLAEETGLIVELDRWMMKKVMQQYRTWKREGLDPGKLAVNLSIKQLEGEGCVSKIKEMMEMYELDADCLELEITESQMMKKPEETIYKLNQISDLGVTISIDDFGTGYSSLSLLKRLPISKLKIDRSFVMDIPNSSDDMAIVQAIIALSKSLKLKLLAEGVETAEQKDFLLANGCTQMQGYYFSYPLSAEVLREQFLLSPFPSKAYAGR